MSESPQGPNALSLPFVEALYAQYLRDPGAVPPEWRSYFERISEANGFTADPRLEPSFPKRVLFGKGPSPKNGSGANAAYISTELEPSYVVLGAAASGTPHRTSAQPPWLSPERAVAGVSSSTSSVAAFSLIQAYRAHGHLAAAIDPLGAPRPAPEDLEPGYHGVTEADLGRSVEGLTLGGRPVRTLAELTQWLRATYCGPVGIQTDHIRDVDMREWIHARVESPEFLAALSQDEERRVLERLTRAAMFEEFIQRKYVGSKSFSLEGSEALIPLLDTAIESADTQGQNEIVFGMAHRGRLNVLANVLGKDPSLIFHEFEDQDPELYHLRGDVKYHLGYSSDKALPSGREIHLSLCYNPSHLEYVTPV
ncbi:MAG TPA: 2-oxoglutarate dehydrogenase E1 component, partial [Candidatus Eisenbacteria bacterium]|nr:2-oxoglutarate dehydrogenase E1 component [Candidatus Eisenbacteria bacterium]